MTPISFNNQAEARLDKEGLDFPNYQEHHSGTYMEPEVISQYANTNIHKRYKYFTTGTSTVIHALCIPIRLAFKFGLQWQTEYA